ncbi:MAG: hypothetical protein AABX85_04595 [Nanoarchaeota archaeon]
MAEKDKEMKETKMPKEEKIGFHKGAISTLMAERNELIRLVGLTENLMNAHIKELDKLGVKLSSEKK